MSIITVLTITFYGSSGSRVGDSLIILYLRQHTQVNWCQSTFPAYIREKCALTP
jgi:hypothetical protein